MTNRLSSLRPDRDRLIQILQQELAENTYDPRFPQVQQVWNTLLRVSTGRKIVGLFGTVGEYCQYSIERAAQETGLETAELASSIRAIVRSLSVRMGRKIPAQIPVTLTRDQDPGVIATQSLTLPRFVAFQAGSKRLYTRETLTFAAGQSTIQTVLYVGELVRTLVAATGQDFQTFVAPEDGFRVSDGQSIDPLTGTILRDVWVRVNGTPVDLTHDGLWMHPSTVAPAVQDRTLTTGELELLFGTGQYGVRPSVGEQIDIVYALSNGSLDNDPAFGDQIGPLDTNISPVTVTYGPSEGLTGGADELPAETYRTAGPQFFAAGGRAVTEPDWNVTTIEWPTVIDGLTLGQRDTAPNDRRHMNVVTACLLKRSTDPNDYLLDAGEYASWKQFFASKVGPNLLIRRMDPVPSNPGIELRVLCASFVDLNLARAAVERAVRDLFAYRYGSLGRTIFLGDLVTAARNALAGIRHVQVINPVTDIVTRARTTRMSYSLQAGTIPAGIYNYAVVAECEVWNGSVLSTEFGTPAARLSVSLDGTRQPQLQWAPVTGATAYHVYGRGIGASNMGLMVSLAANVGQWVDDGTVVPDMGDLLTAVPVPNQVIRFPKLGTLTVTTAYEDAR